MSKLWSPLLLAVALLGAACSSGSTDEVGTQSPATDQATDIPAIDAIDVRTGATVNLQSLVPSETPLLFWFWAPH